MDVIFWVVFGFILGIAVTLFVQSIRTVYGVLRIDKKNPEKELYRFDIDDLEALDKKKRIVLRIDHNADLTQN